MKRFRVKVVGLGLAMVAGTAFAADADWHAPGQTPAEVIPASAPGLLPASVRAPKTRPADLGARATGAGSTGGHARQRCRRTRFRSANSYAFGHAPWSGRRSLHNHNHNHNHNRAAAGTNSAGAGTWIGRRAARRRFVWSVACDPSRARSG